MFTMNIKRRNPNYRVWTTQGWIITGKKLEKVASVRKPNLNLSESEVVEIITTVLVDYGATGEAVKINVKDGSYYVEYETRNPLGMGWLNLGNIILTGKF